MSESRKFLSRGLCSTLIVLLSVSLAQAQTATELKLDDYVATQAGELPIILSAPHGGTREIPDVPARDIKDKPTGGSGYVVSRDTGTEELAYEVAKLVEQKFGRKPYFVISRTHRRYCDPNRPAEIAYDNDGAKPVYDYYHEHLLRYCQEVQQKFRSGLLLDLHGQGSARDTVFRGTKNGLTVSLLRERFGEQAQTGPRSLFGVLHTAGWKVHPQPLEAKEQAGFTGGYIVQHYGSHGGSGVDAIQLEFGGDYRSKENRAKTAAVLVDAIAEYAKDYLTLPETASRTEKPITVAVYTGAGASSSRSAVVSALKADPRLQVRDITVEQIQAGELANCQVVVFPGGSGGGQGRALGTEGRAKVQEFVSGGGGYLGVCAGAYLATCDYDWSLKILDAKVIDRAHWARGTGTVELSLSDKGRDILTLDKDRISIYYHQGPLLAPAENPDVADYEGLATFETEIAKNGAPMGVMRGTTAIAASPHHKGRVICFSPHPEKTTGLEQLLVHAVLWSAGTR